MSESGISSSLEKHCSGSDPVTPLEIVGQEYQNRLAKMIPHDPTQTSNGQGVKASAVETVEVRSDGGERSYSEDEGTGNDLQGEAEKNLNPTESENSSN